MRGRVTKGSSWLTDHWMVALGATAALIAVGVVLYVTGNGEPRPAAGPGRPAAGPGIPPAEYLYLDNARTLAYLSQINYGTLEREERSISQSKSLEAGIEAAPFKAGGSAQRQSFIKQVVTPTAMSNFFELLEKLRKMRRGKMVETPASNLLPERWDDIKEGSFLMVTGVSFELPPYATDYFFLRRSGRPRLRRVGPIARRFNFNAKEKAAVKKWLRRLGKNPRITFSFELPREDGPVRVLVPTQYLALADEQSLITGGEMTVVGKVVRKVDGERDEFVDGQTLSSFADGLARVPHFLIRLKQRADDEYIAKLRKGSKDPNDPPELRAPKSERTKLVRQLLRSRTTEKNLVANLRDATRVDRPGLVLIPLAVYK